MKKILLTIALFLASMSHAFAAGGMTVTFEQSPLFSGAAIFPGSVTARTVTVHNTGTTAQTLYTQATSTTDSGLAVTMTLRIAEGSVQLYSSTFAHFFAQHPGIALGTIAAGATRTFTYTATFPEGAANSTQGAALGFNLIIGFEGGVTVSDGGGSGGSIGSFGVGGSFDNESLKSKVEDAAAILMSRAADTAQSVAAGIPRVLGVEQASAEAATSTMDGESRVLGAESAQGVSAKGDGGACFFCLENRTFSWLILLILMCGIWWSLLKIKDRRQEV